MMIAIDVGVVDSQRTRKRRITSHAPWKDKVGHSRALRGGGRVLTTGTAAVEEEKQLFFNGVARDFYRID